MIYGSIFANNTLAEKEGRASSSNTQNVEIFSEQFFGKNLLTFFESKGVTLQLGH